MKGWFGQAALLTPKQLLISDWPTPGVVVQKDLNGVGEAHA